jgi:hypothetical protein
MLVYLFCYWSYITLVYAFIIASMPTISWVGNEYNFWLWKMKFNHTTCMQFKIKVYLDLVEIMIYAKGEEQVTTNVTFVHHEC